MFGASLVPCERADGEVGWAEVHVVARASLVFIASCNKKRLKTNERETSETMLRHSEEKRYLLVGACSPPLEGQGHASIRTNSCGRKLC